MTAEGETLASIGPGLLVLAGVRAGDTAGVARRLAARAARLRVFADEAGKMNRSALDVGGEVLVVSQFTLYGDTRRGHRPSFVEAARPEEAEPVIHALVDELLALGVSVGQGRFQAHMQVALVNDGPVTVILEA